MQKTDRNPMDLNVRIIREAEASMKAEGFEVADQTKRDCMDILEGRITADDLIAKYVAKYAQG